MQRLPDVCGSALFLEAGPSSLHAVGELVGAAARDPCERDDAPLVAGSAGSGSGLRGEQRAVAGAVEEPPFSWFHHTQTLPSTPNAEWSPRNRLEASKGDRKGQMSIRINDQWRVCFRWTEAGPADVEIVDYH